MQDHSKLTGRQQRFCLLIVQGETQSKAYELAGYAAKSSAVREQAASRLARNAKVKARIAELQEKAAVRNAVTLESITLNLQSIRDKALAAGSFGPAVQAECAIAKLHGFMVDRSELTMVHKPAPLPTKVIELSEEDWIRQFGQGLQESRVRQLRRIAKR